MLWAILGMVTSNWERMSASWLLAQASAVGCRGASSRRLDTVKALVEGFAILDRRDDAAGLYPVVRQGLEIGDVITLLNQRLWQMLAGMAAGAGQ